MKASAAPLALHVFSTFAVGGPQVRFAAIANHLGNAFRHIVVAMDGNYGCAERLAPDLNVVYPHVLTRKRATLQNARTFRQVLRDFRPDVLTTYNWGAIEWAMANAGQIARHVHIEDGFGPEERSTQIRRRVLMRRIFLRRATVALPSRTLWRIATETWRLRPTGLRYIPNGVDLTRFRMDASPARLSRNPAEQLVIGTVAALRAEKNLGRLIRAFGLIDLPARLVIAGDGPSRPELEELVAQMGLAQKVLFTGHLTDTAALYRSFDLFALSSDTEQMPLSVLEAMAAGLPIAATDVGDIRSMVAPENATLLAPCNHEELAGSMRALLTDLDRARSIGQANRAKAEREYDQNAMFCAHAALLRGN